MLLTEIHFLAERSKKTRVPLVSVCQTVQECSLTEAVIIAEPFTADDIEVAVNKLPSRSTQSISRATMSPMINALTNATVASVVATIEEDTEVPVPRRTTTEANQPDLIWQLPSKASCQPIIPTHGEIATSSRSTCTDPYLYPRPILPYKICNFAIIIIFYVIDVRSY